MIKTFALLQSKSIITYHNENSKIQRCLANVITTIVTSAKALAFNMPDTVVVFARNFVGR